MATETNGTVSDDVDNVKETKDVTINVSDENSGSEACTDLSKLIKKGTSEPEDMSSAVSKIIVENGDDEIDKCASNSANEMKSVPDNSENGIGDSAQGLVNKKSVTESLNIQDKVEAVVDNLLSEKEKNTNEDTNSENDHIIDELEDNSKNTSNTDSSIKDVSSPTSKNSSDSDSVSHVKKLELGSKNSASNSAAPVISKFNHFMAGGSIVSTNESISLDAAKDATANCVPEKDAAKDFSDKNIMECLDSNNAKNIEPLNFSTNKIESAESKAQFSNSTQQSLSTGEGSTEDPLKKLNEHIESLGETMLNHLTNEHNAVQNASPYQHHNSDSVLDKENKLDANSDKNDKDPSESFVYAELSNEETGFPDVFTGLVKIGKYISVKGDFTLRSTEALVESPSVIAPYLLKEPDSFPPKEKDSKSEIKDFFHSAAGEVLIGIGISRVNEWFHRDMVRIKKRQIKKSGKTQDLEEDLSLHENFYAEAKKANSVYSFSFKTCKTCGFSTESSVVMEGHLLVPHVTQRRDYQCNFCDVVNRDPKVLIEHMRNAHLKIGRIQPPVSFFECPYCSFESNSKVKLNNHLIKCQRYFDHGINQAPPKDFEFPCLTPKPITVAVVKAYEKSLGSMQRGRGRPKKDSTDLYGMNQLSGSPNMSLTPNHFPTFRPSSNSPLSDSLSVQNQVISPIQMPNMNLRPAHIGGMSPLRAGMPALHMPPPSRYFQVVNPGAPLLPLMGNNHLVSSPQFPFSPNMGTDKKASTPYLNSMFGSGLRQQTIPKPMSNVTITPLPKLTGPYPVPTSKPATPSSSPMQSGNMVVCEICDGYIKDLEQLRTHMQLIHKVKIHPKMLVSRPPLNCQKCQWRFFTDQGLERHLLGSHGLVTSNMQELANKGKDAGCCTICGRVYASKLVSHMNQVHKITLKPAHLSYKCTVCSATFNLYRLFENHVYLVHSGAAKRSSDGRSSPSKKLKGDSGIEGDSSHHKDSPLSKDTPDAVAKCLKGDKLTRGTTRTLKEELMKKENMEKAAA